jgi:quinol monooxygenase YgiN
MSDSSSGKVAVIAKIPAKPGQRDDLAAALSTALETAKGERGTIYYILHTDDKDADVLWMYELYESQAALGEHMGSPAFKALGPAIGGFLGGAPELIFTKPVGGKGL